ncbi:rac GTPase-activating protein 1 [Nelusetta ayraudi]|uniref:rac GTPase-activating protein 1 n=1 Tax=Nelusetta ayraudi TaxID=303726 RepID=UPI003F6E984B
MGESRLIIEELLALCLQRITMEENAVSAEKEMVEVVKNFETVRKRWLHAELELKKYKELLVKSDVAKAALEVKLKHVRNQLDVEMKKRIKVEGDYQYLQRQMQLMCDILVHDTKTSACLNDEQKSLLATFEHKGGNVTMHRSSKRLSVIDESSFMSVCHSDISYDRTDDDVDLDTSIIKPLRSRARERRRSSMGVVSGPGVKRGKGGNKSELMEKKTVDKEVETTIKPSVLTLDTRGQQIAQETFKTVTPTLLQDCADQTSVWFISDETEAEPEAPLVERMDRNPRHVFVSKTVIRPETCTPCGKRIRFGKIAMKCRNCRVVTHPECKQGVIISCSTGSATQQVHQNSLEYFAPAVPPRVPQLLVECVAEIERRGLQERGLYRVPGGERLVKELKDRFLEGKALPQLNKVHDIHVICGVLKDFLRKLKEPLVTFKLHRAFGEAAEMMEEEDNSTFFQTIAQLPKANRDTLAFLMLHLHKVMRSPPCQMDQNNLARVFGPTVVGHGMSEPTPSTIMRDTNTQPKVMSRMLALPESYWRSVLTDPVPSSASTAGAYNQDGGQGRLFKPLTSPELNSYYKSTSRGSLRGRIKNLGHAMATTSRVEPGKRFFTSPN